METGDGWERVADDALVSLLDGKMLAGPLAGVVGFDRREAGGAVVRGNGSILPIWASAGLFFCSRATPPPRCGRLCAPALGAGPAFCLCMHTCVQTSAPSLPCSCVYMHARVPSHVVVIVHCAPAVDIYTILQPLWCLRNGSVLCSLDVFLTLASTSSTHRNSHSRQPHIRL